jgi:DNA polymerase I
MSKPVLDYTEEELRALSTQELNTLLHEAESLESRWNTSQLVSKTLINSLYGAMANKWFPLFNEDMAAAITGNGRYFIRKLSNNIEEALQRLLPQEKQYILYNDTDSVLGSTFVRTDNGEIRIEDLYDMLDGVIEDRGHDNYIKHITTPIKAASVSKEMQLQYNKINYVMKHKVKKRMFKINCNGDDVTITEDHSMMVIRNGKLVETKPTELQKGDKLVKIKDIY